MQGLSRKIGAMSSLVAILPILKLLVFMRESDAMVVDGCKFDLRII
jgi:hypothetical protein